MDDFDKMVNEIGKNDRWECSTDNPFNLSALAKESTPAAQRAPLGALDTNSSVILDLFFS